MDYIWNIRQFTPEEEALRDSLAKELGISPISSSLLITRGLRTAAEARAFIRPRLEELHDPFLMADMTEAEARLSEAVATGEKILIFGDYDVDGTTAVSLLYNFLSEVLQNQGSSAEERLFFYVPDRHEGYGISFKGIDYASEKGCTLIISVDCGIKSVDEVDYAHNHGIDFIICDHHKPDEELPRAVAVLDPHRDDCPYPYQDLSGCGVGFKLMQAYAIRHRIPFERLSKLLPLLAMSIASDIVPITGENRILCHYGLIELNKKPSLGIRTIIDLAGIEIGHLSVSDLIYKIGPRVNACGRIRSGSDAVRLLITDDKEEALRLAQIVDDHNSERKDLDKAISEEALQILRTDPNNEKKATTVVYSPNWHKGVIGIVASRLTETYFRPTIVLTQNEEGLVTGSARSVADFDIYSAIDSCRDLLTNFGGHDFAAGLSLKEEQLEEFKQRFEAYVAAHIEEHQKEPRINVDCELAYADITPQFYRILQCLEPYGPGNLRPIFVTRNVINYRYTKRVGKQGEHLRLNVTDRSSNQYGELVFIDGIAFGQGDFAPYLQNGNAVDICYHLEPNFFNGKETIQMMVQDIKKRSQS